MSAPVSTSAPVSASVALASCVIAPKSGMCNDAVRHVFKFVDLPGLGRSVQVSRQWSTVGRIDPQLQSTTKHLWIGSLLKDKRVCLETFQREIPDWAKKVIEFAGLTSVRRDVVPDEAYFG